MQCNSTIKNNSVICNHIDIAGRYNIKTNKASIQRQISHDLVCATHIVIPEKTVSWLAEAGSGAGIQSRQ